ncbi:MAG TPA: helix-turn-helix domain-containing protein [Puia sp.]|nr:helix-turn-helix domain-containing protein [Puia sp.]
MQISSAMVGPIKTNVLLVDHDRVELDTLSKYLGDTSRLFTAKNGSAAVKMIESYPIHLIISNINLIDTDGSELCSRLKTSSSYSYIPVILLIDGHTVSSRIKCLESGADAYIERPFSREYLNAQIKNLIVNRARIKDYFASSRIAHTDTMTGSKENRIFLNKLNHHISENLPDIRLNVDMLARLMNMSRPTLYRKIKCISDLTPNELINVARLNKAAELISTSGHKISEVAKMVGFNSRSNFGKAFIKRFNVTPAKYQHYRRSLADINS